MAIHLVEPYRIELGAEFDPDVCQWIVWGWISNASIQNGHREPVRRPVGFRTKEAALLHCVERAKQMIRRHPIDGNLVDLALERRALRAHLPHPS